MRARRQIGTSLLLAAAMLAMGASEAALGSQSTRFSEGDAAEALQRATRLLAGPKQRDTRPKPRRDLTTTLLSLSRSLPSLAPSQRRRAQALLARPTDRPDRDGNQYAVPEQLPLCSPHFCVHYVADSLDAPDPVDANANAVPDYVEQVSAEAETVYAAEILTLGWRRPRSDRRRGGDRRVDIYLVDLQRGVFGYTATDIGQGGRSQFGYLVLDNNYSLAEFPGTVPLEDLQVTLAHEYNHLLQFGYDTGQDLWLYEASATWIEDYVYPDLNDYLRYLRRWSLRTKVPVTKESIKIYGSAVFNHWLAARYGRDVVRTVWERARRVRPAGFSVDAYTAGIKVSARRAGRGPAGKDMAREFALFAFSTAEWQTPGAFPYVDAPLWTDVQRRGRLRPGRFLIRKLSHTGYLMFRVTPRDVPRMRLLAGARRGTRAAFGLVCREGPVETGLVRSKLRFTGRGGVRGVTLRNPGRCSRITAVIVNADTSQDGFAFGDWRYRHDHERFAATLLLRA